VAPPPVKLGLSTKVLYLRGYADTDRFNPYQDVRGFLGHTFLELIPNRLRRIFGGGP